MDISTYLQNFKFNNSTTTESEQIQTEVGFVQRYINEFWTSQQRQANALHEVAYRACFKPQLPAFFINWLSKEGDIVYDPFTGRGTTIVEAALLNRQVISNDINPLSRIFTEARINIPTQAEIHERLDSIDFNSPPDTTSDRMFKISLDAFFHKRTEQELATLSKYLTEQKKQARENHADRWIRMVATNRLTGHSPGFFSVYTLPPNQAVSIKRQMLINEKRKQIPEYRDVKTLILKKSKQLLSKLSSQRIEQVNKIGNQAQFFTKDASQTFDIQANTVQLTVTSPPFLDVVQYSEDNWLRFLFNGIDAASVARKITTIRSPQEWAAMMSGVFHELYRITKSGGFVAFEVGEVRKGKIELDKLVVPLGVSAGFICEGIMINNQNFTKTANIWGISNNAQGTNTNRIVIFKK